MNESHHGFRELFEQLGLPSDDDAIHGFIRAHAPLPDSVKVADADFWTPAQARFLREAIADDADWAHTVDLLNASLRVA